MIVESVAGSAAAAAAEIAAVRTSGGSQSMIFEIDD